MNAERGDKLIGPSIFGFTTPALFSASIVRDASGGLMSAAVTGLAGRVSLGVGAVTDLTPMGASTWAEPVAVAEASDTPSKIRVNINFSFLA